MGRMGAQGDPSKRRREDRCDDVEEPPANGMEEDRSWGGRPVKITASMCVLEAMTLK